MSSSQGQNGEFRPNKRFTKKDVRRLRYFRLDILLSLCIFRTLPLSIEIASNSNRQLPPQGALHEEISTEYTVGAHKKDTRGGCPSCGAPAGNHRPIDFLLSAVRYLFFCFVVSLGETGRCLPNPFSSKTEFEFIRSIIAKRTPEGVSFLWCSCGNSNPGPFD